MATVASLRVNSLIKNFYDKLIKKGKKVKIAIVACMHKLLSILNSVAKRQSAWLPSFSSFSLTIITDANVKCLKSLSNKKKRRNCLRRFISKRGLK